VTIKSGILLGKTPFLRNKSIETESQSSITEFDPEYIEMNDDLPQTILRLSQNLIHPATSDSDPDTHSRRLAGQTTTNPPADSWDRNSAGTKLLTEIIPCFNNLRK
jgi:hypothetical protein